MSVWRRDQLLFEAECRHRRATAVIMSMSIPDLLLFFQDAMPYVCSFLEDVTPTLIDWLTPSLLRALMHGVGLQEELSESFWIFLSPTRSVVRQDPGSGVIRFAARSDEECVAAIQRLSDTGILHWVDRTGQGIQDPAALIARSGRVAVFQQTVPDCIWIGRYAHRFRTRLVCLAMEEGRAKMLAHLLDGPDPLVNRMTPTDDAIDMIKRALAHGFYDCARVVIARLTDERHVLEEIWELYRTRKQTGVTLAVPVQPEPLVDYAKEMLIGFGLSTRRHLDSLLGMTLLIRECEDRLEPCQLRDGLAWLIERRFLHAD